MAVNEFAIQLTVESVELEVETVPGVETSLEVDAPSLLKAIAFFVGGSATANGKFLFMVCPFLPTMVSRKFSS